MTHIHEGQLSIGVADPGRFPPPPGETYLSELGIDAYQRQREQWLRHNRCLNLDGCDGKNHAIGCPKAKTS